VVPEQKLSETVDEVIGGVLKGSPTAQAFSKHLVTAAFESDFDSAFEKYLDYQEQSLKSEDHARAMQEYRNRKEPRPKGAV
jgi:hypothetical protein